MEKKKGRGKYYFFSLLPLLCSLLIQVVSGVAWSFISSAIYATKAMTDGNMDIMNDMEAYMEGAIQYVMQHILYAVVIAQILTLIAVGIWYGILVKKQNFNRPIKECLSIKSILMCVCLGLGLQFVVGFVLQICGVLFPGQMEAYSELIKSAGIGETTILSMIATVILAPISEEILFRGLTMRFLKKAGARFMVVNVIQALFFGILHMNLVQGLYAFVIGLVLGCVAEKCKTIILPILLHLAINLSGTLLDALPFNLNSWLVWGALLVVGIGFFTGGIFLLNKEKISEDTVSVAQQEV